MERWKYRDAFEAKAAHREQNRLWHWKQKWAREKAKEDAAARAREARRRRST